MCLCVVLCWTATPVIRAQEPELTSAPQRITGGVVEEPDSIPAEIPSTVRLQSPIFRDTLPLSRMSAISLVAPGFSQLYNHQYWKIPVLYGTVGTFTYLTIDANKNFQRYQRQYDLLVAEYFGMPRGSSATAEEVQAAHDYYTDYVFPAHKQMNHYNRQRSFYFVGAAFTYLYFLADGVINYPHYTSSVKRATTLAFMFPGAGQFYNRSYWKIPIVVGAFTTMGFLIDWNNRGYQRFRTAFDAYPNDEFSGRYDQTQLSNWRRNYRRNRDLCIILTGAAYLLSVVEAHVDAHLKDFDVTDDLALRVEPTMLDMSGYISERNSGYPGFGLSMKLNF
ncbi:MAG: DUF5683 domain-containing protein [Rikenellaceae bacterium]|nr:DUF5683 domain-containing protein [Rikenellaceae bacterium]